MESSINADELSYFQSLLDFGSFPPKSSFIRGAIEGLDIGLMEIHFPAFLVRETLKQTSARCEAGNATRGIIMTKLLSSSTIELTQTFHYSTTIYDYDIRWTCLGNAASPPLIFVHGTPWSSHVWHTYALSLSQYFRVYLFDNPGFGDSPLGKPLSGKADTITKAVALDADLAQQSEVFAALYKFWAREWQDFGAHVVAHDHGGLMTLRAHLLHGCDFRSLCLIDVVALGPFGQPLFKLVAENEEVFNALTGPVFEGVVESYIRDAAYKDLDRETMAALKRPWIASEDGRKAFVRQMVQANSRSTEEVEGR
ncbi:MAG: hypothetical protein LQ348_003871 [Seirophora lacunosa]|nr:MAG: hypothetical protein LQ348_003871 [Seirophora lacunosa]